MAITEKIYEHLRRKTNSTSFIPQIDGLRFLAIIMVVLFHINIFVINKIPFAFTRPTSDYWWLFNFLQTDRKGVLLFFVISGFILALPFAKAALGQGEPMELKKYYLRRLTRLEPPYFLVMIASFLGIWLLPGHGFASALNKSLAGLLPSLGASLGYMHNIVFSDRLSLNPVVWSLEIEIQFYLLVPLLVLVFKLPSFARRLLLVLAIAGFVPLQHWYKPGFYSLYNYVQYFLLGFLLVDLFLSEFKLTVSRWATVPLGILCLIYIWYSDVRLAVYIEYIFMASVFTLYTLALTETFWKKIFSVKLLTAIGGMCYSIYLLHFNIISVIGNTTIKFNIFHSYPLAYLWHALIFLPAILLSSAIFYLLVERPCMDKSWPVKLWNFFRRKFGRPKGLLPNGLFDAK